MQKTKLICPNCGKTIWDENNRCFHCREDLKSSTEFEEFGLLEDVNIVFPNGDTKIGNFIKEEDGKYIIAANLKPNSPIWIVKKSMVNRYTKPKQSCCGVSGSFSGG